MVQEIATIVFDVGVKPNAQDRRLRYCRGVELVQSQFQTIEIVDRLAGIFGLTIRGKSEDIAQLREVLEAEHLGTVLVDDPGRPPFRGAGR